jgi:integrase
VSRKTLTVRKVESKLKPAGGKKREDHHDALVPGLALRVTETGHKSYVLVARYPANPKNPTRRSLGDVGKITLDDAREKARTWLALIEKGKDPKVEEERQWAAQRRLEITTFAVLADEYLKRGAKDLAKHAEAQRIIEAEFVKRWARRPAGDITSREIAAAIGAIRDRGSPYQAHNALGYIRRLYNWAIGTQEFGIDASPVAALKPKDLIGEREARAHTLEDPELRAVWDAAGRLGNPYGALVKLLILTGQREREIADMSWSEVDLEARLLTIPGRRMKGGAAHEVPLSETAVELLKQLPLWNAGDFVFTTTAGEKPVNGFSKAKQRIDQLSGVTGWKFHDLRRTARTRFSALPVQDIVRELVIAHAKPGLHKVYDQHSYQNEKRRCLELWEKRLLSIVEPRPGDVTALATAREGRRAEA